MVDILEEKPEFVPINLEEIATRVSAISSISCLLWSFVFTIFSQNSLALQIGMTSILYGIAIILIKKNFSILGRITLIFTATLSLWHFSSVYSGTILAFPLVAVVIPCISYPSEFKILTASSVILIIGICGSFLTQLTNGYINPFSEGIKTFVDILLVLTVSMICGLSIFFFSRRLEKSNASLIEINLKMKKLQKNLLNTEKSAAIGRLVRGFAHELATPLGIVRSSNNFFQKEIKFLKEYLKEKDIKDEEILTFIDEQMDAMNGAKKFLDRMGNLIRGFKKLSIEEVSHEPTLISLNEIIKDLVMGFREENSYIAIDFHEINQITKRCDPKDILFILDEILENSLVHGFEKITEKNEMEPKIIISLKKESENKLELSVSDNGVGFADIPTSAIFDPFYSTKKDTGSLGIGLTTVLNYVTQLFEGTIEASSKPFLENKFVIKMPIE